MLKQINLFSVNMDSLALQVPFCEPVIKFKSQKGFNENKTTPALLMIG
jgi:hypothetical protein